MKIHWFQHVPFEGLGSIEPWLRRHGHTVAATRLYAGELPPSPDRYDWLIVMGGPMNIYEEREHPWLVAEKRAIRDAIGQGRRVLGICLGAQLIADVLGAPVTRNAQREIGWFPVELTPAGRSEPLFADFPARFEAYHWHGDTFGLPAGATQLASSAACRQQAYVWGGRVVGLQFHLETTPDSVAALIRHCGDELVPAPHVQDAAAMLAEPARFARLNTLMDGLLGRLAAVD
jgi:GMP synthase-like glutamine amidotransferase